MSAYIEAEHIFEVDGATRLVVVATSIDRAMQVARLHFEARRDPLHIDAIREMDCATVLIDTRGD